MGSPSLICNKKVSKALFSSTATPENNFNDKIITTSVISTSGGGAGKDNTSSSSSDANNKRNPNQIRWKKSTHRESHSASEWYAENRNQIVSSTHFECYDSCFQGEREQLLIIVLFRNKENYERSQFQKLFEGYNLRKRVMLSSIKKIFYSLLCK